MLLSRSAAAGRPALLPTTAARPARPAPAAFTVPAVRPPQPRRAPAVVAAAASGASTVRVNVQGRHLEVTDALKAYAEEKVSHALHNFEGAVKSADVKLSVAGGDAGKGAKAQKTEVTIYTLRHGVVRVEDVEASAYASIDVVCDKVRGKLRRLKEKAMQRGRWPGSARPRGAKPLADELMDEGGVTSSSEDEGEYWDGGNGAAPAAAADPAMAVIREKTFTLTRMTAADAAEAADLLGHSFYVYQDAESGGVRVVYKRSAAGYGVIIPNVEK